MRRTITLEQIAEAYYRIATDLRQGFLHLADREAYLWFAAADRMFQRRGSLYAPVAEPESGFAAPFGEPQLRWRTAA